MSKLRDIVLFSAHDIRFCHLFQYNNYYHSLAWGYCSFSRLGYDHILKTDSYVCSELRMFCQVRLTLILVTMKYKIHFFKPFWTSTIIQLFRIKIYNEIIRFQSVVFQKFLLRNRNKLNLAGKGILMLTGWVLYVE